MKFFPFWNMLDYHNPEVSLQPAGCIHAQNKVCQYILYSWRNHVIKKEEIAQHGGNHLLKMNHG